VSDTVSFWGTTSDAKDNWNINSIWRGETLIK
jgi:hypothetical protein